MGYRFSRSLLAAVVAASFALPTAASAQLFTTGPGTPGVVGGFEDTPPAGVGQGVVVTTATNLTQFGFYGRTNSGDYKFLIFENTTSTLLFSQAVFLENTITGGEWLESGQISFNLDAGKTYYFGLINYGAGYALSGTSPPGTDSENGLALTGGAIFYTNYSSPSQIPPPDGQRPLSLSLRLEGTQGATTTPEPSSMALLGTGLVALVPMVRRRRR